MNPPATDYERQRLTDLITLLETSIAEMRATLASYQPIENKFDTAYRTYYEGLIDSHVQMLALMREHQNTAQVMIDFVSQWGLRN